jgi:hypothetical protein
MPKVLGPNDIDFWRAVIEGCKDSISVGIKWSQLRSGTDADSDLKVRKVLRPRMLAKSEQIKGRYLSNFPFCVRDNGPDANGVHTYTVFDGNHRYHAIGHWIQKGTQLPDNPYSPDFKVPCLVFRKDIPIALALQYATLTNDMQRCASAGTAMDFLRFIKNIRYNLSQSEG